ncbi:uncharacterized protein LOC125290979 [Alosa alosa]|nr:uncharacterized protein LOC125290979 [Alosa alosa]XP_048093424.1 uncharacterized protein LOC125290979 [Alosa alosa]XP_048093425.1 uncharacterized protein LOC125290979 [Alosa alosa]
MAKVVLKEVVCYHGVPADVVSDRGPQFVSRYWKAFWSNNPKTWSRVLVWAEMAHNQCTATSTGGPGYSVKHLLDCRRVGRGMLGYGPEKRCCVPARHILDQSLIRDFRKDHPGVAGPSGDGRKRWGYCHASVGQERPPGPPSPWGPAWGTPVARGRANPCLTLWETLWQVIKEITCSSLCGLKPMLAVLLCSVMVDSRGLYSLPSCCLCHYP